MQALQGLQVLVTRPAHQAGRFNDLLLAAGAIPRLLPVITIEAVPTAPVSLLRVNALAYDWVIFISANAVHCSLRFFSTLDHFKTLKIAAIGKQTASSLEQYGLIPTIVPKQGFTSEDFLALPQLQNLSQQRMLIVRGEGGREVLADTLTVRGATVSYANVYKRYPSGSGTALKQLHAEHQLDIICITSSEILQNLIQLLQPAMWMYQLPIVVGSARIATYAQQLGFNNTIIVATSPADHDMLAALLRWRQDNEE